MENRMKAGISSLALTAFVLLASAGMAHAADNDMRQVWRDSEGQIVRNSTGNCVRSRWIMNEDPCNGAAAAHTIIAEEDRTVYFAFNRAEISPESKKRLDSLAPRLNAAKDIEAAEIIGFADRIGTVSYNEALSKKRALAVRDYLVAHGLVKPSETEVRWVGKSQPSANCADDLPRAQLITCLQPDRKATVEIEFNGKHAADASSADDE
jgi:outer membrane protein OmpA-like peptidoglycan-associated protein